MTIQNIEDVMDRIMSLNRNLTEDSLRTLLSASGWDKDDIVEGLRLFKLRASSAHSFSNTPAPAPAYGPDVKPEDNYSFNIKKPEESKIETPIIPIPPVFQKDDNLKVVTSTDKEEIKTEILPAPTIEKELDEDKPKKSTAAKIFSLILILILILLALAYFFPSSFGNFVNKIFIRNNNQVQIVAPSQNINASSSVDSTNSSSSLANLLQEVSNLRDELNSYKAQTQPSKTIVKYISQRGPVGKAGRGVSSVSATSTGFVINYTDDTSVIIPFSTTTIISILNSNSVCFRDVSSTSTQISADICLDRNVVSKLIASSTNSR